MTAHEFDELIARLSSGASRRDAVRGIVGGALASASAASMTADGEAKGGGKNKKPGKQAAGETNAVGNGKRIFCDCPDDNPENCTTRRVKTKKFKKLMRQHPNSHRGPCQETTSSTTSSTSSTTSTTTSTTTTGIP